MSKSFNTAKDLLPPELELEEPTKSIGDSESTEERNRAPVIHRRERKTERLNLLVTPSIKKDLQARADAEDRSINDICNELIRNYLIGE